MNATSVSPTSRPNLCFCGHPLTSHNLAVTPNTCSQCTPSAGGALNVHPFTSSKELNPVAFPCSDLAGIPNAGGGGVAFFRNSTGTGNGANQSTLTIGGFSQATFNTTRFVGLSVTTFPANIGNQQSYTIIGATFNAGTGNVTLTLLTPLRVGTNNTNCLVFGVGGSGKGGGRPPNGQRAG